MHVAAVRGAFFGARPARTVILGVTAELALKTVEVF